MALRPRREQNPPDTTMLSIPRTDKEIEDMLFRIETLKLSLTKHAHDYREDEAMRWLLETEYVNLATAQVAIQWAVGMIDELLNKRALAKYESYGK